MMVVFVGSIVLVERESPSVTTVLLCKLALPSIGAVLPVCPCHCLRVRLSLRVRLMSTLYEPPADPAVDESSILEPLPAPIENDSSFALTF